MGDDEGVRGILEPAVADGDPSEWERERDRERARERERERARVREGTAKVRTFGVVRLFPFVFLTPALN